MFEPRRAGASCRAKIQTLAPEEIFGSNNFDSDDEVKEGVLKCFRTGHTKSCVLLQVFQCGW